MPPAWPVTPPDAAPPAAVAFDTAAARTAWAFVEQNTTPATGLANAIHPFQFVTAWDIASLIGATYSAHALGIITDAAYDTRPRAVAGRIDFSRLIRDGTPSLSAAAIVLESLLHGVRGKPLLGERIP